MPGDAAALYKLYADDAVNHQIALQPVVGRIAIEQFHRETFGAGPLTCNPVNLVVEGEGPRSNGQTPTGFVVAGSSRCATARSRCSAAIGTARN